MAKLTLEQKIERAKIVSKELKRLFPKAKIALNYSNPWELLVAVILSAQCTDKMVNIVTEKLFKKYPNFEDYLKASQAEFEQDIRSTGFYHNKAKNILAAAQLIKQRHQGRVPDTMEQLLELPGVARKTANIVLESAFGVVVGIPVDTHVKRLAGILELSDEHDPVKIEQDLMEIFPRKEWDKISYELIEYGRKYCPAKKHDHANCPLTKVLK
jgi:endonuclease-3